MPRRMVVPVDRALSGAGDPSAVGASTPP